MHEFELRFSPIEDDALMVVSDVTDRNRSIRELNAALKKAEGNEKLQSVFLSNLSHELRTPMNGIIGFADLLLESEKDPQKQEYLKIILDSSNQLHNVLSDIIEMSKLEAGTVQAKTEIIGLKKIIADICASMQSDRLIAENNVQIVNLAQEHEEVLIISDNVNTSAMVLATGDILLVTGDLEMMSKNLITFSRLYDDNDRVSIGDKIVTSNISDKYLPGLLVGYVSNVSTDSNNLTKSGTLIPAVDFKHLEEVLVIMELKENIE